MTEDDIRRELARIAVLEIGKKSVASTSVKPDVDFDEGETLEILVVLKPDAPSVSGKTYTSILLKAYDFLHAQKDKRRPSIALERLAAPVASTAK
jgi:hypothetical protein